jgi:DNA-directed RNA polymerase subunit RPC12/RpoP
MGKFKHHRYFQQKRLIHSYLFPHVCFECRNSFKKAPSEAGVQCPSCEGLMIQLSRKFRPPKKTDLQSWAVVEYVVQAGFRYQSLQTEDGRFAKYPSSFKEAEAFVLAYQTNKRPSSNH